MERRKRTKGTVVGFCCVFFFQAEDGIRDHCVTGVQTCALPIQFDQLNIVKEGLQCQLATSTDDHRLSAQAGIHIFPSPAKEQIYVEFESTGETANIQVVSLDGKIDRKSVVQGKSVDLGGRRIIKKKNKKN